MEALKLLESVSMRDTKQQILEKVAGARAELNLMDIHQVAALLDGNVGNIRKRAINNNLGTKIGNMGRVYSNADVEELRRLIKGGLKPKTVALRAKMITLKDSGLTNRNIAAKLGVHPSYVTILLKNNGGD